jgi:tetrahydromethanopterin S-methyltransferase subunit F
VVVLVVVAARYLFQLIEARASALPPGTRSWVMGGMLTGVVLAYALLMALPFVPGIEIGITLMMMQGPAIAPVVYLATLAGLSTAYLAGRYLSYDWLQRVFRDMRQQRASNFIEKIKDMDREQRLASLQSSLPIWCAPLAIRSRYIMLAVLVNLPGNFVLGGGGGIFLVAGLSRLFSNALVILTIALAVLPVPVLVWVFGVDILGK